jgi:predicted permease
VNLRAALSRNGGTGAGRGAGGVHGALAAAETALALILLAGAGLMIRSMANLFHVALGFNSAHVLTLRVHLPEGRYRNASQVREFCDRLLASSSALPGVRSAAISTSLPLMDSLSLTPYRLAGTPEPNPGQRTMADFKGVSEDYFRATGTALLRGRLFTAQDAAGESPQVAIINQALARQLSPGGGDPLGRALVVGAGAKTIVGIVAGSHQTGLDSPVRPEMFLPTRSIGKMTMILRTAGEPMAYAPAVSAAVWAIDPSQPVSNLRSLEEQVDRSATQRRFDTVLFNGFGALALLLAGLGIYGALAHSVALRKREMGVRMAVGARPASVKALVFLGACKLTLWGFAAGVPLALALTRCMRSIVFGVSTADPATFAVTALLLFAVAALASYVPAARAARHNPLAAMRGE